MWRTKRAMCATAELPLLPHCQTVSAAVSSPRWFCFRLPVERPTHSAKPSRCPARLPPSTPTRSNSSSRGIINGYPCGNPGEPCNPPANRPYFRPSYNVPERPDRQDCAACPHSATPTPTPTATATGTATATATATLTAVATMSCYLHPPPPRHLSQLILRHPLSRLQPSLKTPQLRPPVETDHGRTISGRC